jgi:hypothetical protein
MAITVNSLAALRIDATESHCSRGLQFA